MPKLITNDVKEIILKVKEYFIKEKVNKGPLVPLKKIHERVAAATGVSVHTVSNIVKEGHIAAANGGKFVTQVKIRKTRKDKIVMDEYVKEVVKRKIYEYQNLKKEMPTINKLHHILKEEIAFKGSREILRQQLKAMGFQFKKTKKTQVDLDREEPTELPKEMIIEQTDEELPTVYLDESFLQPVQYQVWQ